MAQKRPRCWTEFLENPNADIGDSLQRWLQVLLGDLSCDRASLFVLGEPTSQNDAIALMTHSSRRSQPAFERLWQVYERKLVAEMGRADEEFVYVDSSQLRQRGIEAVIDSVVILPVRLSPAVSIATCLSTANQWILSKNETVHLSRAVACLFELLEKRLRIHSHEFQNASVADLDAVELYVEALESAKEQAEQNSRSKSKFLANMSHEFRTPMNAILGMTNLALETKLTPEQFEYLDAVRSSGNGLLALINDIVDSAKIEANELAIESAPFDLRRTLGEAFRPLGIPGDGEGARIQVAHREQCPELSRW